MEKGALVGRDPACFDKGFRIVMYVFSDCEK